MNDIIVFWSSVGLGYAIAALLYNVYLALKESAKKGVSQ